DSESVADIPVLHVYHACGSGTGCAKGPRVVHRDAFFARRLVDDKRCVPIRRLHDAGRKPYAAGPRTSLRHLRPAALRRLEPRVGWAFAHRVSFDVRSEERWA